MRITVFFLLYLSLMPLILFLRVIEKLFDENGYCMPFSRVFKQAKIKSPHRLIWEVTPDLEKSIKNAVEFSKVVSICRL